VARQKQLEFERACDFVWAETAMAARAVFAEKIRDQQAVSGLEGVITELSTIAMDRSATDDHKRAGISAYAARARCSDVARDAGEAALARWHQMKPTIPPQPQPGDAVPDGLAGVEDDHDDRLFKVFEME
jgi:hypothetical protein